MIKDTMFAFVGSTNAMLCSGIIFAMKPFYSQDGIRRCCPYFVCCLGELNDVELGAESVNASILQENPWLKVRTGGSHKEKRARVCLACLFVLTAHQLPLLIIESFLNTLARKVHPLSLLSACLGSLLALFSSPLSKRRPFREFCFRIRRR